MGQYKNVFEIVSKKPIDRPIIGSPVIIQLRTNVSRVPNALQLRALATCLFLCTILFSFLFHIRNVVHVCNREDHWYANDQKAQKYIPC